MRLHVQIIPTGSGQKAELFEKCGVGQKGESNIREMSLDVIRIKILAARRQRPRIERTTRLSDVTTIEIFSAEIIPGLEARIAHRRAEFDIRLQPIVNGK